MCIDQVNPIILWHLTRTHQVIEAFHHLTESDDNFRDIMASAAEMDLWVPVMVTFLHLGQKLVNTLQIIRHSIMQQNDHFVPVTCSWHEISPFRYSNLSTTHLRGNSHKNKQNFTNRKYLHLTPRNISSYRKEQIKFRSLTWLISIIFLPPRPTTSPICSSAIPIVTELPLSSCRFERLLLEETKRNQCSGKLVTIFILAQWTCII